MSLISSNAHHCLVHPNTSSCIQNAKLFKVTTVEHLRSLANNEADVDSRESSGLTPLMVHTDRGEKELVQELIRLRANIDLQDNRGAAISPLVLAKHLIMYSTYKLFVPAYSASIH